LAERQQVRPAQPAAVPVQQGVVTDKQRAATGPFLAYVNLCKPLLMVSFPPQKKEFLSELLIPPVCPEKSVQFGKLTVRHDKLGCFIQLL
jgi:hypothetical protein